MSIAKDVKSSDKMEKLLQSATAAYLEDPVTNRDFFLEVLHAWRTHSWAIERVLKLLGILAPDHINNIKKDILNIAHDSSEHATVSASDWGRAKTYVFYGVSTTVNFAANKPFPSAHGAVWLQFGNAGWTERYGFATITKAYFYSTNWLTYYQHDFQFPVTVPPDETLWLNCINASGVNIAGITFSLIGYTL